MRLTLLLVGLLASMSVGCVRDSYQVCCDTCSDLSMICTQGARLNPHEAVEASRMCMESYALCYRACYAGSSH